MAIDFACGNCGKWFHLGDEMAGNRGRCSGCGEVMRIPDASRQPAPSPKPAPTPASAAWVHDSDPVDDEILPRRAPAAAPSGGGGGRRGRSSRRSSGTLDFSSMGDIVDAIVPTWIQPIYRFEGGILVAASILVFMLAGVGAISTRAVPLAVSTLLVGVIFLLQGFLLRFGTWLYLLFSLLYFYIAHVASALCGLSLIILLVVTVVSGKSGPTNLMAPRAGRPNGVGMVPPVGFQPQVPMPAPVAIVPGRNNAPFPGPANRPNAEPFPGPAVAPQPRFDHEKFQADSRARMEKFQAESRERHERMLREIRERNDQMRQRMRPPQPNRPVFQPPTFP